MRLEIKIRAVGDALKLVPLLLFILAIRKEAILQINAAFRIMGQFFRLLPVLSKIFSPHAEPRVPVVAVFDPTLVPLYVIHLAGLEDGGRLDEKLNLHLLELARAKDEIARRYLVTKSFADLRHAERQFAIRRVEHVLEIDEDALRGFGPQVSQARLVFDRADGRAKHKVELPGLGQII